MKKFEFSKFHFHLYMENMFYTARLNVTFLCTNCFQNIKYYFKTCVMYSANLGDTFGYIQRRFSMSTTSRKVQIIKHTFHVQVEVEFWKFDFFQFCSILTARLIVIFLCPNCFQNIKYHSKNMPDVYRKLGRYFWIPSMYVFDVYNVRKSPNCKTYFSCTGGSEILKIRFFSISPHSYRKTKCNFPLSKLLPKHQILFQKHA